MKRHALALLLTTALAGPALACGESGFNTGKGLEFQGYLAPRPATVLIYGTPDPTVSEEQHQALLQGLKGAGHRVVVVDDADAYVQALRAQKVDLVIAGSTAINTLAVAAGATAPRLVPVLAKGTPKEQRDRFGLFLRGGASLGQYLRAIDRVVAVPK
jgi:ABC-type phosphate/phosphonate transport system substrate-binding protein